MDYEEYKRKALEPIVNYIESVMASYSKEELEARIKKALPEKESEDERIRKHLLMHFKAKTKSTWCNMPVKDIISYLEKQKDLTKEGIIKQLEEEFYACGTTPKWFHDTVQGAINHGMAEALGEIKAHEPVPTMEQKEQPKEELVYRMNGLMQEYYKAGEDDAEREHRFKCYQLFWDALEDADFFEQKEQKPIEHLELKAGHWYICHRAYCCRADHLTVKEGERFQCEKDGIVKGFVVKEPEKYFIEVSAPAPMEDEQQPAEWSEEDERMLSRCIKSIECSKMFAETDTFKEAKDKEIDWLTKRFKSLRPQPISHPNTNHTVWHNASEEKPTKLPIIHIWYHGNRVNAVVAHENIGLQAELNDISFQPDDKWAYVEDLLNAQPHWKPSEEQIIALARATNRCVGVDDAKILIKLLEQLEKL